MSVTGVRSTSLELDVTTMLDVVDRLQQQHRAGIPPTYGQVEDLFESAATVRRRLSEPAPEPAPKKSAALIAGWGGVVPAVDQVVDRLLVDAGDRRVCLVLELPPGTKLFGPGAAGVREVRSAT